jgi:hypothetical protein
VLAGTSSTPAANGGIVVFVNGKILGGDSGFTWVGTFIERDGLIKGRVTVHNFDPNIRSVLEVEGDYEMYVSGVVQGDTITGTAMIANQPQHSLAVRLDKWANL